MVGGVDNINNLIDKIRKMEERFSKNKYDGEGPEDFVFIKGNIPVMISTPHAVNHFKKGKTKYAEVLTGGISSYLGEVVGCHVMCLGKQINIDPNYDDNNLCRYKQQLKEYVEVNKIEVLLDLHGTNINYPYAVELGTSTDTDSSLKAYRDIVKISESMFTSSFKNLCGTIDVCKNIKFAASGKTTVTKYIADNTDAACMQIEVNKLYRDLNKPGHLYSLTSTLIEIIEQVNYLVH